MAAGPFYAYARSVMDGTNGVVWRYLMTFASRDDADDWWRIISQSPSPTAGIFERVTPQYYTFKQFNIADFILQQNFTEGKTFQNMMFFTLLNDRDGRIQSTFPQEKITDHVSDDWYYIRSRSDPDRFWYCNVGSGNDPCLVCGRKGCDDVHVSTQRRSRFYIRAPNAFKDGSLPKKDMIMIRADQITIAPSKEYVLEINNANELKAVKSSTVPDFVFSDIGNRFTVRAMRIDTAGGVVEYVEPVERGCGEVFEIVA